MRHATLAVLLVLLAPAAALAAAPASLPDVEDEVMCTQCGTPLNISEAPAADRQRAFIRTLIDQGRTKAEVKTALREEYGARVLAIPSSGGFDHAAWIVPVVMGLGGILGVAYAARRWRRGRGPEGSSETDVAPALEAPLDPTQARRLEGELAAFDR